MIFESMGGVSCEAERVIKSLNQVVAAATDSSPEEVATRFWQRVSIDIQRAGHRAFARRAGRSLSMNDGVLGNLFGVSGLEMPEGL